MMTLYALNLYLEEESNNYIGSKTDGADGNQEGDWSMNNPDLGDPGQEIQVVCLAIRHYFGLGSTGGAGPSWACSVRGSLRVGGAGRRKDE